MQDHSTTIASDAAVHPEWCWQGRCEVTKSDETGFFHGRHFGDQRQGAFSWDELAVSIATMDVDPIDGSPRGEPMVALRIAEATYLEGVNDQNKWRLGDVNVMEPEEAEMLARWLLKAVDEWREAVK